MNIKTKQYDFSQLILASQNTILITHLFFEVEYICAQAIWHYHCHT